MNDFFIYIFQFVDIFYILKQILRSQGILRKKIVKKNSI